MAGVIELVLERDGHDQPWGFRLQGGSDLGMPLSIQRVLVGTPAEGALHRGDIITKISCTETKNITHQQAVDLFNSAGNQITVQLKRAGVQPAPVASAPISVPLVNGSPVQAPVPVPVSGGVPLPGIANTTLARPENPAVKALPKTQFSLKSHFARQQQQKSAPPNLDTLSIQSQPYRTLPLLQPSAKPRTDLGVSSISHLKTQDDYFTMQREPQYVPQPQAVLAKAKQDEFIMKQKVRRQSEAALASVVSVGGGEEEYGAGSQRRHSLAARQNNEGGEGPRTQESSEDSSKKSKKKDANADVKKINKFTFKVGGEIVQLKKPPASEAASSEDAAPQVQLRKQSAGNVLIVEDREREEQLLVASKSAKGRSRSLGYTVYTTQLEEDSDQVLLTAASVQSLTPRDAAAQSQQAVECTVQLAAPRSQNVSTVEVEHTVKLPPTKPKTEVQSVDVSQTVRVQRDYYMW